MNRKKLHIICHDVPYPVDHGGMFDLFYKIEALHASGTDITLHCFEYGRGRQEELVKYCSKVYYYKRKKGIAGISLSIPYIVSSRIDDALVKNLQIDDFPILMEGAHTTFLAFNNSFPGRTILFRLHNIEQVYYKNLFRSEKNLFKKLYYHIESGLLAEYEKKVMRNVSYILTVSRKDSAKIATSIAVDKVKYLPVFLPFREPSILEGIGSYCLYHGNLSVAENSRAVRWLVNNLNGNSMKLIVAGKNPSVPLANFLKKRKITLVVNPSDSEIFDLIQNAQINIVLSFNETGIKLKLLNALFHGRQCVANEAAIPGVDFEEFCTTFSSSKELNEIVSRLAYQPLTKTEMERRKTFLIDHFNNTINAEKLSALL
jgi:hypothetical protein